MFNFFKQHPRIRYFTIAGIIVAGFCVFWFLFFYIPLDMGWMKPLR